MNPDSIGVEPPPFLSFSTTTLILRKLSRRLFGRVSFSPKGTARGQVLLSCVTHPFTITKEELLRSPHTNPWECLCIVDILLAQGFNVDVIDWNNTSFLPKKKYDVVIDIRQNLERLSPFLSKDTIKIYYMVSAYWRFQNTAEEKRTQDLKMRRNVSITPHRTEVPAENIAHTDYAIALGNGFAAETYPTSIPIPSIPLLSIATYPSPQGKPFDSIRKNFVFIGGGGAVHKGLDLVLEVFAQLPDYTLTICGPMTAEKDFAAAYEKELRLPNVHTVGRIDVRGPQFKKIVDESVGLIYPSCSEGQAGSVVVGLHAGLIPIITRESGVDAGSFGFTLADPSINEIRDKVVKLSQLSVDELQKRAVGAWTYARSHHTIEKFKEHFSAFLDSVFSKHNI